MFDEFTLNEIDKYIQHRLNKLNFSIKKYEKTSYQYIVYKNLIMEVSIIRDFVRNKKGANK